MTNGAEIITVAQMRAIDAACAVQGTPTRMLMENAGRAVAGAAAARFSPRPTAVVCGPGNNGGDGWVAARALKQSGWPVWVETIAPRAALSGDAADAAKAWDGEVVDAGVKTKSAELIVDAMFGAGLSRPLSGKAAELAQFMAAAPAHVIAIDVPSGVEGDTGKALGDEVVRAALTITFVRKKPAHLLMPGRALCGEVIVADIGAPPEVVAAQHVRLWENGPDVWRAHFPWPAVKAHKHARGHVMVASGGHARTGAARLAARAALRVGAGLVTVLSPPDAVSENAAQLTAIMLREAPGAKAYSEAASNAQCLVIGPAFGTGDAERAELNAALGAPNRCPFILDADAITLLAPLRENLDARDVMTPHPGEFERAFPSLTKSASSRIEAARAAAARAGCVVLLKGPDTVIAAPDGGAIINATGTPFLATAGSGDVLAGLIGGLIGQGMPSFHAAAAAAWLHGRAAEIAGAGLIAEDLPEILPRLLNQLGKDLGLTHPVG